MLTDLPPGTEDYDGLDSVVENNKISKDQDQEKASSIRKYIESRQIKFVDGTTGPMLEYLEDGDQVTFLCYPCEATCHGEHSLQDHMNGKKHTAKLLSRSMWPKSIMTQHPYLVATSAQSAEPPSDLLKTEVKSRAEEYLSSFKTALIGLEYFVEILDGIEGDTMLCTLCNKRGVYLTITNHLTSFKHKFKYLMIHFPTVYRLLEKYKNQHVASNFTLETVHRICERIEKDYGRRKPITVEEAEFNLSKAKFMNMAFNGNHITERDGKTYVEMVDDAYSVALAKKNRPEDPKSLDPVRPDWKENDLQSDINFEKMNKEQKDYNIKITLKTTSLPQATNEEKDLRQDLNERRAKKDLRDEIARISSRKYNRDDRRDPLPERRGRSPYKSRSPHRRSRSPFRRSRSPVGRSRYRTSPHSRRERSPPRSFNPYGRQSPSSSRLQSPDKRRSPARRQYSPNRRREWSPKRRLSPGVQHPYNRVRSMDSPPTTRSRSPIRRISRSPSKHSDSTSKTSASVLIIKNLNSMPFSELASVDLRQTTAQFKKNIHKASLFEEGYKKIMENVKNARDFHEKNPERHHLYQEEWKKFWNKRYKELKNEKVDVSAYNFKPEWIIYWSKKIKEMYDEEFEMKKSELCRKLALPTSDEELISTFQKTLDDLVGYVRKYFKKNPPPILEKIFQEERDQREQEYAKFQKSIVDYPMERSRSRSSSRFIKRPSPDMQRNYRQPSPDMKRIYRQMSPEMNRGFRQTSMEKKRMYRQPSPEMKKNYRQPSPVSEGSLSMHSDISDTEDILLKKGPPPSKEKERAPEICVEDIIQSPSDISVISVLRLLTALENYLGSLGNKVVDALAMALKMEKEKPNSSENMLMDDEHCVLFETVKEKLKGQLLAGFVEGNAVQATKRAIQYIASLIHMGTKLAEQEKKKKEIVKDTHKAVPITVEGIGAVEKAAIAHQIATALIANGRTNVTTEELEALVNSVVGMVQSEEETKKDDKPKKVVDTKNKESSSNNSTANALQMLQTAYASQTTVLKPPIVVEEEPPATGVEGLSDSDLQTLLQNFEDLSSDEQNGLITYLKNLEKKDPKRVESLRHFVSDSSSFDNLTKEKSPLSMREKKEEESMSLPPPPPPAKVIEPTPKAKEADDEDDDDDYTFDDVLKSASAKVKETQIQGAMEIVQKSISESKAKETRPIDINSIMSSLLGQQASVSKIAQSNATLESISKVLGLVATLSGQSSTSSSAPATIVNPAPIPPPEPVKTNYPPPNINADRNFNNFNEDSNDAMKRNMQNPDYPGVNNVRGGGNYMGGNNASQMWSGNRPMDSIGMMQGDGSNDGTNMPPFNRGNDNMSPMNRGNDNMPPMNRGNDNMPPFNRGNDNMPPMNRGSDNMPPFNRGNDNIPPMNRNNDGNMPQFNRGNDNMQSLNRGNEDIPPFNRNNDMPPFNRGNDDIPPFNRGNDDIPPFNRGNDDIPPFNRGNDDMQPFNRGNDMPFNNRGGLNRNNFDGRSFGNMDYGRNMDDYYNDNMDNGFMDRNMQGNYNRGFNNMDRGFDNMGGGFDNMGGGFMNQPNYMDDMGGRGMNRGRGGAFNRRGNFNRF